MKFFKSKTDSEAHKREIEEYNRFIAQVYLCASNNALGERVNYVCIHRQTKALYAVSAKKVGHRGIFDEYCLAKQPERITNYPQLLSCLSFKSRSFYRDLNKTNWENYFDFMFLPPEHNGEVLKKQLLSRDSMIVRNAVFAVHNLVLKTPAERKAFLADAYESLPLIQKNLENLEMGGIFASNHRFANRAIQIIEGNNSDKCFCRLLIDDFGPSADGLATRGFVLIQPDKSIDDYSTQGVIQCPICYKKYSIIEEYTGWHIPTRISCIDISE